MPSSLISWQGWRATPTWRAPEPLTEAQRLLTTLLRIVPALNLVSSSAWLSRATFSAGISEGYASMNSASDIARSRVMVSIRSGSTARASDRKSVGEGEGGGHEG